MNFDHKSVPKPIHRSPLRKKLGKEYFCMKQNLKWVFGKEKFVKSFSSEPFEHRLIHHRSFLLRKLKDVDMYLQKNKVKNLELAIGKMNGIIIRPGETFSLWKLVGRPTKSKGYLEGMTLSNGKVEKGIGGGLCQLGNLLYWMLIHTELTVTKRWRHSYDVFPDVNRKIPFGSGATLSYNYVDLQFVNLTDREFHLHLWLDESHLNGAFSSNRSARYKFKVYEKEHKFELQYWGGYTRHNQIWRKKIDLIDQYEEEELVTENHAIMMYNPLLE